jgi:putative acetyltransferase
MRRSIVIRRFIKEEAEALAEVYRDAVRTIAPQSYTREQVAAWALYPEDLEEFRSRLACGLTLVAEDAGRVVAFGQLQPDDHLAFLYCCGSASRKGLGSEIYRALEAHAFSNGVIEIHTEASRISRPFFEKHGYSTSTVEHVVRFGVEFERFRMSKKRASQPLEPTGSTSSRQAPLAVTPRADAGDRASCRRG